MHCEKQKLPPLSILLSLTVTSPKAVPLFLSVVAIVPRIARAGSMVPLYR